MELMHSVLSKILSRQIRLSIISLWVILILAISFIPLSISRLASGTPRQNNPPEAVITEPENGDIFEIGEVVHFDGSDSSDPDNDALIFKWDFGDGTSGTGAKTSHVYNTPWVPIVTLEVTDGELNNTARVVIVIGTGGGQNRPPTASIDSPNNLDTFSIEEIIYFDGSSSEDYEDDPLTFNWDFGDGNTSSEMITTHAYSELRPYQVTLTVSDGMFNDSERILIFVNNTPPKADAGEDKTGYLGQEIIFDGSNSSDPDRLDNIENYTWDLDDNTFKYGSRITHKYRKYGTFTVTLTVEDGHGETGSDEVIVMIKNAPPVGVLKLNSDEAVINRDLEFDASDSYDPDGEIEEYYYNFGDGTETDWIFDSIVLHQYDVVGEYIVTLQVKDDRGEVGKPVSLKVNVVEKTNQPPSVTITYPNQGESVAGLIIITGTAVDPDNEIKTVEVMINEGRWRDADISSVDEYSVEWEFDWDTEDYSDGDNTIIVRAWDGDKYSNEQSIIVNVNNRPTTYIELTEELKPNKVSPGEKVTVSGFAKYDTDVPVANTKVEISIKETNNKWSTQTNEQGQYSYKFTAPLDAGTYTIRAYITDGSLERETSEKLTVEAEPPDLSVNEDEILFSTNKPKEKDTVKIIVTIYNIGGTAAVGRVYFYLDEVNSKNLIDTQDVDIPAEDSITVSADWVASAGRHEILIKIDDVVPVESDSNNNLAVKQITVTKEDTTSDDKGQENLLDSINNLPPIYKYGIIAMIVIIILVVFAMAYKVRSGKKGKTAQQQQGVGRVEKLPPGMVVFKPLEEEESISVTGKQTKKPILPIIVLIFAILSIIMMGISLTQPWYQNNVEAEGEKLETEYSFEGIKGKDSVSGLEISLSWDDELAESFKTTRNVYNTSRLIVIAGFILGIFLLIGAIVALFKKGKKAAIIFGLLAFIVCLLAPIIFMLWHPGALAEDIYSGTEDSEVTDGPNKTFIGSREIEALGVSGKEYWGPAIGWYLAVAGAIFALLGFIFAIAIPKPIQDTAPSQRPTPPTPFSQKQFPGGPIATGTFKFQVIEDEDSEPINPEKKNVKFETIGIR
jgi:PKD repeat protein